MSEHLPDAANDDLEPYELIVNLVNLLYYDLGGHVSRLSIPSLNKISRLFMPFARPATKAQLKSLGSEETGKVWWLSPNSSWRDLIKWLEQAFATHTYDPNEALSKVSTLRELNAHVEQLFKR